MSRSDECLPDPVLHTLRDSYGLGGIDTCRRLRVGSSVTVFAIGARGHDLVVRVMRRSQDEVARQVDLIAFLATRGVPVAAPVETRSGERCVALEGRVYALFPLVTGEHPRAGDTDAARIAGSALARVHAATRAFDRAAPNPRYGMRERFLDRTRQLAPAVRGVLADPALRAAHDDAAWLLDRVGRIARELRDGGFELLPSLVIHGDFNPENLVLRDGAVAAILDFDLATRDARVADVAIATQYLARSPAPEAGLLLRAPVRALLDAYEAITPLTSCERAALPPLIEAKVATSPMRRLLKLAAAPPEGRTGCVAALRRSTQRLRTLYLDPRWSDTLRGPLKAGDPNCRS